MAKFAKTLAIVLILGLMVSLLDLWFQTYIVGQYYTSSGFFLALVVGISPFALAYLAYLAIKWIANFKR